MSSFILSLLYYGLAMFGWWDHAPDIHPWTVPTSGNLSFTLSPTVIVRVPPFVTVPPHAPGTCATTPGVPVPCPVHP